MKYFLLRKKEKGNCIVMIVKDRATDKYCFVNLTHPHVCKCRFDTVEDALEDLNNREEVIAYYEMPETKFESPMV